MIFASRVALVALVMTSSVRAEPQARTAGDATRQVIDYQQGKTVPLRAALGYQLMIELAPDEQVQNIAIGDASAWQINLDKNSSRIFIKAARANDRTNMTVITSVRTYSFDLEALAEPATGMPYAVMFDYPLPQASLDENGYVDVSAATRRLSKYTISGDPELRPELITNDGRRTYITWPSTAPIPAVFDLDTSGKETLVNGTMGTDDVYVVDGVPELLLFRIDRSSARAERVAHRRTR
jgi:type IV secretion system protein VirB9